MAVTPESGFLLLADLTGYTAYLSGSELEHAPVIAGDLLETVVGRLEPPYRLAKFEGDAGFLFAEDGHAESSQLLDSIEACYVAFRRRLRSIDQATTCDCNSCRLAPRLDLKVFVHHGAYVHSRIAGRDELAGPDVILVHRLLKGGPGAERPATGFALLTKASVDAMGVDPAALGLTAADETVEQLGSVSTWVWDLEARWQAESAERRLDGAQGAVFLDWRLALPAEPSLVWAYLTSPALRAEWEGPIVFDEAPVGGRRGVGTVTRCVTGQLSALEEIVDWQPFEHIGWRLGVPGLGAIEATADLEPDGDQTNVRMTWVRLGQDEVDATVTAEILADRRDAFSRLANVVAGARAG